MINPLGGHCPETNGKRDAMPVGDRAALKHPRSLEFGQESSGQQPSIIQSVFNDSDITCHIFATMPASVLLRCTMVCRSFRATIDTSVTGEFERHLCWTGYFMDKWVASYGRLCCVGLDAERSVLSANVHVACEAVQYMWRLNVVPEVDKYVHMNMRMYLPLAHVDVAGDAKRIARLKADGDVSVDVRKWQIVEVNGAVPGSIGRMQLKAVLFAHNSPVKLQVHHDILVDFHNVPVAPQTLSYRSLCVMRCVRVCMHCYQRIPLWQSLDVSDARHRVLCSLCHETLYVRERQLQSKWKVCDQVPMQAVPRAHFVHHKVLVNHRVYPDIPVECMLKQDVAEFLGCQSWTVLLTRNHRNSNNTLKMQQRCSFYSR